MAVEVAESPGVLRSSFVGCRRPACLRSPARFVLAESLQRPATERPGTRSKPAGPCWPAGVSRISRRPSGKGSEMGMGLELTGVPRDQRIKDPCRPIQQLMVACGLCASCRTGDGTAPANRSGRERTPPLRSCSSTRRDSSRSLRLGRGQSHLPAGLQVRQPTDHGTHEGPLLLCRLIVDERLKHGHAASAARYKHCPVFVRSTLDYPAAIGLQGGEGENVVPNL